MSHQINRTKMDYFVHVTYNIFEYTLNMHWIYNTFLYIDFTFLGDDIVVHINVMILSLFFPLPISFPFLFCYSLVDMRVSLGTIFVLILIYLVSDKRQLSLSKHELENLFFFTYLIWQLGATRKFLGQGRFLGIYLEHMKERSPVW